MKDLSKEKHSMTSIISENLAKINSAKSVSDMVSIVNQIFDAEKLNTPASRRLIGNISKQRSIGGAQLVVYNSVLCGCGEAVIK